MAYYFECPQCHENNYGLRTAPTATADGRITYFDDLKCSRCGVAGLYWVANERAAEVLTRQRVPVPRNRIAVGIWQSSIGWFDPQGRAEIQSEVVGLLRNHATLSASFNQGQRHSALLPERVDVAEGLCEGMSLHWIRRVLQGGKTTFKVDKEKGNVSRSDAVMLAKLKRQLSVGANVQVTEVRQEWTDQYLRGLGFTKSGTQWSIPSTLSTLWDETQAKGKYAKHWDQLKAEYDRQLNVSGRQSARPFSNIVAVSSTVRSAQTLADFAAGLCRDPAFRAGTAALFSVGLRVGIGEAGGRISGHAIAGYCRSDTEFFLFDPNIGVFTCTTRDNFRGAVEVLIGEGWTTRLNWVLEGTFGYSLFQARSSPSSVQPSERPLLMTPSPQSTAIENRGLLPSVQPPVRVPAPQVTQPQQRPATPPLTTTPTPTPSGSSPTGGGLSAGRFRPQGPAQPAIVPNTANPNQQLKRLLQEARDKPERQVSGAFGRHGNIGGGWVSIPFTLKKKIEDARLTTTEVIKVGPDGTFAIAKTHMTQLIEML